VTLYHSLVACCDELNPTERQRYALLLHVVCAQKGFDTNRLGREIWQIHLGWQIAENLEDVSKSQSRSAKAGLQFPVGRVHRLLKKGNYAQRVGAGAPGSSCLPLSHCVQSSLSSPLSQSIWLLFLSTSLLKFLSLPVMQLVITRNNVLSLVIFN
jgi:hypothetical protein